MFAPSDPCCYNEIFTKKHSKIRMNVLHQVEFKIAEVDHVLTYLKRTEEMQSLLK